jgi:Domain of unknown function (DUF222)/HNH endonuclease
MTETLIDGSDLISAVAAESNEELAAGLEEDFRKMAIAQGRILVRLGEVDRRQAFRNEGATSTETWTAERFGVSTPTARTYTHVGQRAWDVPHLVGSLCAGDISFDKVRAVADMATGETDLQLRDQARGHSVRELTDIARAAAAASPSPRPDHDHDRRSLRFNDSCRTITAQLPPESYAEAKTCIDAWARDVPNVDEVSLDQRRCDGFTRLVRSSSSSGATMRNPFFVVAHVPLAALVHGSDESEALAGELEHDGLIDTETVQKIACDATVAVAVDDDVGHTMYEGRAQRFATAAQRREVRRRDRHCRFPGCENVTFADVHHVVPWKPGGPTDLHNLALVCEYHHRLVHSKGWTMSGNANEELHIVGPTGRAMVSRPSPLWARVTAGLGARSRN